MNLRERFNRLTCLTGIFIFMVVAFISSPVQAACNPINGWYMKPIYFNFPASLAVGNHVPDGTVIHTQSIPIGPSYQKYARCTSSADNVEFEIRRPWSLFRGTYRHASAPGIGIRMTLNLGVVNGAAPFIQYPFINPPVELDMGPDPKIEIEVIKISNLGGQIPSGELGRYWVMTSGQLNSSAFYLMSAAPVSLITTTCQVSNPVINVPMGDVNTSVFSRVGSTSPARNFTIRLNCDPQANVSVTVDAAADPSRAQGVLSLTALTDKANGVGIQVLQNNAPVTFGQVKSIGTSAGGIYNIPMSARYYQTQGQVTSGRANGTATFTMTYN
ncbi:fimbrial protein [Pantoea agglomerans]